MSINLSSNFLTFILTTNTVRSYTIVTEISYYFRYFCFKENLVLSCSFFFSLGQRTSQKYQRVRSTVVQYPIHQILRESPWTPATLPAIKNNPTAPSRIHAAPNRVSWRASIGRSLRSPGMIRQKTPTKATSTTPKSTIHPSVNGPGFSVIHHERVVISSTHVAGSAGCNSKGTLLLLIL